MTGLTQDEQKVIDALKSGKLVLIDPKLMKRIVNQLNEMDRTVRQIRFLVDEVTTIAKRPRLENEDESQDT